jgi:Holliday junction resolvase
MTTPERKVKDKVVKILKEFGAFYFYPVSGGYGSSGVCDIIVCYHGRFIGIECKSDSNTPTALQAKIIHQIQTAGGMAVVIREDNIELVCELLEGIRDGFDRRD